MWILRYVYDHDVGLFSHLRLFENLNSMILFALLVEFDVEIDQMEIIVLVFESESLVNDLTRGEQRHITRKGEFL